MPSIGGISIFYMIMGLMALLGIQLRTKSFAFTGLVLLVCGGSLIAYFPEQWIRIGFTLAMMAFASLLLKIYQDKV